jgi:hypothetical protein
MKRCKNFFNQVLNVHGVHDVRQMDTHTAEQGVKHYILRYTDLFVLFGIRRNCHSNGRNLLLYKFIKRAIRLTVIIIEEFPSYQLPKKYYLTFFWPG